MDITLHNPMDVIINGHQIPMEMIFPDYNDNHNQDVLMNDPPQFDAFELYDHLYHCSTCILDTPFKFRFIDAENSRFEKFASITTEDSEGHTIFFRFFYKYDNQMELFNRFCQSFCDSKYVSVTGEWEYQKYNYYITAIPGEEANITPSN